MITLVTMHGNHDDHDDYDDPPDHDDHFDHNYQLDQISTMLNYLGDASGSWNFLVRF